MIAVAGCSALPTTIDVAAAAEPQIERPPTTANQDDSARFETPVQLTVATPVSSDRDPRAPISLGFAGDTSFHNDLHLLDPLAEATPVLSLPDLMVVNLETAVAPVDVGLPLVEKRFLFRSDPAMAGQMARAGIDVVSLANNHALDFGSEALSDGLRVLENSGIATVGGGVDAEAAYKPIIQTVGEWTVGIAAFSRVPCDWAWNGENLRPEVAWVCPAFEADADGVVSALVDDVDLSVVMVHGGTEGQLCPDQTMRDLNQHWAGLGVDLVVNSHPHVVQGVSSIGETVIINSLGNFAFPPSYGLTANSAVFLATLTEQGLLVSVEPFVSEGGVPRAGSPLRRRSILSQIDNHSEGWRVLPDGRLIQDNSWPGVCTP
jgi:poly-gamma-glutamate synthesis protein (capsule biosynthesis protein)